MRNNRPLDEFIKELRVENQHLKDQMQLLIQLNNETESPKRTISSSNSLMHSGHIFFGFTKVTPNDCMKSAITTFKLYINDNENNISRMLEIREARQKKQRRMINA